MAGIGAKTANPEKMLLAEDLAARGVNREQIWKETGWFKGSDDKWRFELPSENARLSSAAGPVSYEEAAQTFREKGLSLDKIYGAPGRPNFHIIRKWGTSEQVQPEDLPEGVLKDTWNSLHSSQGVSLQKEGKLEDYLHFPELYEAYPELKDIKVKTSERSKDFSASYTPSTKTISINPDYYKDHPKELLDTFLHEVQHAIQVKEFFSFGTTPEQAFQDALFKLHKEVKTAPKEDLKRIGALLSIMHDNREKVGTGLYMRQPGEIEARLVEARRYLSKTMKKESSPPESQEYIARSDPNWKELPIPP